VTTGRGLTTDHELRPVVDIRGDLASPNSGRRTSPRRRLPPLSDDDDDDDCTSSTTSTSGSGVMTLSARGLLSSRERSDLRQRARRFWNQTCASSRHSVNYKSVRQEAPPLSARDAINDTIRYDTRCYFNVRSKADISQLNLPRGTDN